MATAARILVNAWEPRPTFIAAARDAVLAALKPGAPLTSKELYRAALAIPAAVPAVEVRTPRAPPAKQDRDKRPVPAIPHPEHAIRSLSFLKTVVLPDLEARQHVQKVHRTRALNGAEIARRLAGTKGGRGARDAQAALASKTVSEWVWERVPEEARAKDRAREKLELKLAKAEEARPFGWEVGVGDEFAHLNKRRQRRRLERVERDVELMKALQSARKVARAQEKQKTETAKPGEAEAVAA